MAYEKDRRTATFEDVTVSIDWCRSEAPVRWLRDSEWTDTPWQTADIRHLCDADIAKMVFEWLYGDVE